MLARGALQGIKKSLEDPEYRARLEERLAQQGTAKREPYASALPEQL